MSILPVLALFAASLEVSGIPLPGKFSPLLAGRSPSVDFQVDASEFPSHTRRSLEGIAVFDFNMTDVKRRTVLAKYNQAQSFLEGINIIPENDITEFVSREYPVSSIPSAFLNANKTRRDTGIIPGDQQPFTSVAIQSILPLRDFVHGGEDVMYYGEGTFGTHPSGESRDQTLSFDIDTGSADLWVPSRCADCPSRQFEPDESSTYQPINRKFSINYASGSAKGTLGRDKVSMAGLSHDEQTFGLVNQPSDEFAEFPSDGLLGLSFGTIARSKSPTFVENLIKEKKIRPLFSLYLNRDKEIGSQLCLGCIDQTKMLGTIHWASVVSKTYWTVGMDGLNVNGLSSHATGDFIAAIDSGTTLIYFPMLLANQLYQIIPGARPWTYDGYWTFPCASDVSVGLIFDGKVLSIHPDDFTLGRVSEDSLYCIGGIIGLDEASGLPPNLAIIGDELLKSWYTIYSYENGGQVGFSSSIEYNK